MAASKEQKRLIKEFTHYTGMGFMDEDEVDKDDPRGFMDIWETNIESLRDIATDAERMINNYRNDYWATQPPLGRTYRHG